MTNPYFLPELGAYRKPPTDPRSLGVNMGKPYLPPSVPNSVSPQTYAPKMGMDQILGGLTGGFDIYNSAHGMANQSLGLNPQAQGQYDMGYQPSYNMGQDYNQAAMAKPQGATGGEVLGMGAKGAAAGAAFGPIGAGVGFVGGAVAGLIGGKRRKKKQQREKEAAQNTLKAGQQNFNKAEADYTAQQNAAEDYQDRMNTTNRMYNLYATR